ncbi:MAG: energy transducer TonB [Deltaproteobacteria bacterium]|nr:energy transducer TonB [Deltaproteobacteria bacterium]
MIQKKLFITAVVLSVVGHMAVFALSGMVEIGSSNDVKRAFTIQFEDESTTAHKSIDPKDIVSPEESFKNPTNKKEDTVELGSNDTPYSSYLKPLKKKIETSWTYPRESYDRREKGITVVTFSITEEGQLVNTHIIAPSGYDSLDDEALRAVRSAGPLEPLPPRFNLSKLHVIARFLYNLAD